MHVYIYVHMYILHLYTQINMFIYIYMYWRRDHAAQPLSTLRNRTLAKGA